MYLSTAHEWNFIQQISRNFPGNCSGKVSLFFRKNSAGNFWTPNPRSRPFNCTFVQCPRPLPTLHNLHHARFIIIIIIIIIIILISYQIPERWVDENVGHDYYCKVVHAIMGSTAGNVYSTIVTVVSCSV